MPEIRTYDRLEMLQELLAIDSPVKVRDFLQKLPIAPADNEYYDPTDPKRKWIDGKMHWVPVGMQRGNAGRIQLASTGENALAERVVNAMESIIELMRQRELREIPGASTPQSPREAVERYFAIPPLDQILERSPEWTRARSIGKQIRLTVTRYRGQAKGRFTVRVEDEGIGQPPNQIHNTLLSLSNSSKGDKPYLIGVFGQGGSSAFHGTQDHSWLISRRAPDVPGGDEGGAGWSLIKHVFPKDRRDAYYAYLAVDAEGAVPHFSAAVADAAQLKHGSIFTHIDYDLQRTGSSVARNLYPAMNHLLFNPVFPYELRNLRDAPDVMWGNAYRLTRVINRARKNPEQRDEIVDKTFGPQSI